MTTYLTDARKAALKERLKGRFPTEMVDVNYESLDGALEDFLINEVDQAITAALDLHLTAEHGT